MQQKNGGYYKMAASYNFFKLLDFDVYPAINLLQQDNFQKTGLLRGSPC
jgi:hypothetical protein